MGLSDGQDTSQDYGMCVIWIYFAKNISRRTGSGADADAVKSREMTTLRFPCLSENALFAPGWQSSDTQRHLTPAYEYCLATMWWLDPGKEVLNVVRILPLPTNLSLTSACVVVQQNSRSIRGEPRYEPGQLWNRTRSFLSPNFMLLPRMLCHL